MNKSTSAIRRSIALIFPVFAAASLCAQEFNSARMDSLFDIVSGNDRFMGSVSVFRDGEEIYGRAVGMAGIEAAHAADTETGYRMGSISKTFTATLIMKLVEDGKLSLNDTLSQFIPEIPHAGQITINHLLRHRSGIFNFTNSEDYIDWHESPISRSDLIAKIAAYGSDFAPGSQVSYSNSNFVLLTFILEDVSGKTYSDLLRDWISEPCDLERTYVSRGFSADRNEAYSYNRLAGWEKSMETDPSVPLGAGSIVSTPRDLNRFCNCLFEDGLLSESTLDTMKNLEEGFGIGMFRIPFYDRYGYGHTGGIDAFRSVMTYFPDDKLSIALVTNGVNMDFNEVTMGVLSIYYNRSDYQLPEFKPAHEVSTNLLDSYVGVYATEEFPMDIAIQREGNTLIGQATGQPAFTLEAVNDTDFRFVPAGLELQFDAAKGEMTLLQGGATVVFKKK